jgi:hypothetical protein
LDSAFFFWCGKTYKASALSLLRFEHVFLWWWLLFFDSLEVVGRISGFGCSGSLSLSGVGADGFGGFFGALASFGIDGIYFLVQDSKMEWRFTLYLTLGLRLVFLDFTVW